MEFSCLYAVRTAVFETWSVFSDAFQPEAAGPRLAGCCVSSCDTLGAQCWPEELTASEYLAALIIDTRARHSSCAGRQLLFHQMILTPLRWREDLLASRTGSRVKHGLNMWECDLDVQNCKVLTIMFPTS